MPLLIRDPLEPRPESDLAFEPTLSLPKRIRLSIAQAFVPFEPIPAVLLFAD
jgi:hypothetical protein